MTDYDELLIWASEKESGSLDEARAAAESTLGCHMSNTAWFDMVDDLVVLGHIEATGPRWRVCRPALSLLSAAGGNGLMLGARPRWLLQTLHALDDSPDDARRSLADHVLENVTVRQEGPSTWYLSFGPEADLSVLAEMGVRVVPDLAEAALLGLEGASHLFERTVRPGELSARLDLEATRLDGRPRWEGTEHDAAPGIYRYLRNRQRVVAERNPAGWVELDLRLAIWRSPEWASRRIKVDVSDRRLEVPGPVRLPTVVERAIVLRTGRLPMTAPGKRIYENVTTRSLTE